MQLWEFLILLVVMVVALIVGIWASRVRKRQLRETVLQNLSGLSDVIELVRRKKSYQAENLLINRGNSRSIARMTVVVIRDLLKSGEVK